MSHYIAVDSGKYNTKVASYDTKSKKSSTFKLRTKISDGTFIDDMFRPGTVIVQIDDGPVYKIGAEGKTEPSMETSKKSEIHRVMIYAAVAMSLQADEENVPVAIGMPLQYANVPEERLDYKNYIFGEEGKTHTVKIKTDCNKDPRTIKFSFGKRLVYPEGIGVIYNYPKRLNEISAVIDIGNLNTNNIYCDHLVPDNEFSFSDELGGKILIANLAHSLEAELGMRVNENLCAKTLLRPIDQRYLVPVSGDKAIQEKSKEIIDKALLDHASIIRQKCDTRHWPLGFMNLTFIGGTSSLLRNELVEVFGDGIFIPENAHFVNATGFLKKMCADNGIDITESAPQAATA